ncbi:MAG: hypothetical protein ACTSRI_20490 [Promethearchaeota archaeon]
MYLFQDKEVIEIPITCKLCLADLKITISAEEYQDTKEFPLKKENIHGDPAHNLVVFFNKYLEIENFTIEDVLEKEFSYSEEITRQVLSEIELNDEEIKLYFLTTGRDVVSLGEMSLLIDKSKPECEEIAKKFVQKGLFKEIIGATPHYTALPPYAALISQLKSFHNYISDIKNSVPVQLNQSFTKLETKAEGIKKLKDYSDFMEGLKQDMLSDMSSQKKEFDDTISTIDQIRGITGLISNLEIDTKNIMDSQIKEIAKQFEDIKAKISSNLQKLRLGVVQQTVDQVIDKVLTDGLNKTTERFNTQFISKLKELIENIAKKVTGVTASTAKSGENIKQIFENVSESFSRAVIMSEEKIAGISDTIFKSFGVLRDIFSSSVIDTLNEVLSNILKRLDISEITTNEFWEQTKKVSLFTMKDIWFIRSIEAAKANIIDEISKAKMRILIVAPQITDIELKSIQACPTHMNIRIATHINLSSPDHVAILEELDKMHNVTYRHRELQDIWGINRDYEGIVIAVVSKTEIREKINVEIGGIGSIIPEHIKIFVPILEDVWRGSFKEIPRALKTSYPSQQPAQVPTQPQPFQQPVQSPIQPQPSHQPAQSPIKPTILSQPSHQPAQSPIKSTILPHPSQQPAQSPIKPTILPQPTSFQAPILEKSEVQAQKTTITKVSESSGPRDVAYLSKQYDLLLNNIDGMTAVEVSSALERLYNEITEIKGYSSVLNQIQLASSNLKVNPALTQADISTLKKKMSFWRKKLHI